MQRQRRFNGLVSGEVVGDYLDLLVRRDKNDIRLRTQNKKPPVWRPSIAAIRRRRSTICPPPRTWSWGRYIRATIMCPTIIRCRRMVSMRRSSRNRTAGHMAAVGRCRFYRRTDRLRLNSAAAMATTIGNRRRRRRMIRPQSLALICGVDRMGCFSVGVEGGNI